MNTKSSLSDTLSDKSSAFLSPQVIEKVHSALDNLTYLTNMPFLFADPAGTILFETGTHSYCHDLHLSNKHACVDCIKHPDNHLKRANHTTPGNQRCDNGFNLSLLPVKDEVGLNYLVVMGPFLYLGESEGIKLALEQAEQDDVAPGKYLAKLKQIPRISLQDQNRIQQLVENIFDMLYRINNTTNQNSTTDNQSAQKHRGLYSDIQPAHFSQHQSSLKPVISALPGIFYELKPDTTLTMWNDQLTNLTGKSHQDLTNVTMSSLLYRGTRKNFQHYINQVLSKGSAATHISIVNSRDKYHAYYMAGVRTGTVGNYKIMGIGISMSEKQHAEQLLAHERSRLFAIFDNLPAAVYLQADDYSIRYANRIFRQRYGNDLTKKCYSLIHGQGEACTTCPTFEVFKTGKPNIWEWTDPSSKHSFLIYNYPFIDADGSNVVLTMSINITKRVEAEKELEYLAATDPLTGLNNRRQFFNLSRQEIERMRRHDRKCCLLMLDLDNFKQVNDNYGHPTGDDVIKKVAGCLAYNLRNIDIIGRLGGEEFAILLPETDQQDALLTAERLRKSVSDLIIHDDNQNLIHMTISIGIACMQGTEADLEKLIQIADDALYAVKNSTKNAVKMGNKSSKEV